MKIFLSESRFFSREYDRSHRDASIDIKMLGSLISFDKLLKYTIEILKILTFHELGPEDGLKIISYLLIGFSERAKNLVLCITFYALSNGLTHFKIKKFSYADLCVSGFILSWNVS